MKKTISFLALVVLLSNFASAQKISFADSTNIWSQYEINGGTNPFKKEFHDIYFTSTRTMNGYTYTQFTSLGMGTMAVRQDSTGKVYMFPSGDTAEVLLYDFGLQLGDTFTVTSKIVSNATFTNIVSAIDSTQIGNTWHKVWTMHNIDLFGSMYGAIDYKVIEGIGSPSGFLFPLEPWVFEHSSGIYCFQNNGNKPKLTPAVNVIGPDPFDNESSCLLSVKNIENQQSLLEVFPQPATGNLSIRFPYVFQNGSIAIDNLMGQNVYNSVFRQKDIYNISYQEKFKPGVYVYRIIDIDNSRCYTGKIIFE